MWNRSEVFLICVSSFSNKTDVGHFLVIQIKNKEGDQDRVRLVGLWIKAGFKTAKIGA